MGWKLGFVLLPTIVIAILPTDIVTVLDGTFLGGKDVSYKFRKARENNKDNRIEDEFSNLKIKLRAWVVLNE